MIKSLISCASADVRPEVEQDCTEGVLARSHSQATS